MDMNTNRKTGIICIVASILVVSIIIVFRRQETSSNIETLRHNLEVAIDSVQLNPVDYYGYNLKITYQDYNIEKRLYMPHYYSKDSTKCFNTIYEIDEKTRTILSGPVISDNDTDAEVAAILEKDEHTQAILLQLLQFRKIAELGTITSLHGWMDLQPTREVDMWFFFWYKRDCYNLTHYTDHEFSPTDTIVHGDWQLRKVEPLPW